MDMFGNGSSLLLLAMDRKAAKQGPRSLDRKKGPFLATGIPASAKLLLEVSLAAGIHGTEHLQRTTWDRQDTWMRNGFPQRGCGYWQVGYSETWKTYGSSR